MRRDDRDAHLVLAGLDLVDLHPFGKSEQRIAFHHDLVSLSTQSDECFWRAVYHPFSPLPSISSIPDSPKSAMSHSAGGICIGILVGKQPEGEISRPATAQIVVQIPPAECWDLHHRRSYSH